MLNLRLGYRQKSMKDTEGVGKVEEGRKKKSRGGLRDNKISTRDWISGKIKRMQGNSQNTVC